VKPVQPTEHAQITKSVELEQLHTQLSGTHVVIAEDFTINAKILRRMIESIGQTVTVVSDGVELVTLYK
jgi:hypothetical protein